MAKEKNKGGRPSEYTTELAIDICERIGEGEAVKNICKEAGMPSTRTFYVWLNSNEEFVKLYARAKEDSADYMVDEMREIADDEEADTNRSRLRIDTRKWVASKLKTKKYGDKTQHEVTHKYEDTSEEELKKRLEKLRGSDEN